MSSTYYPALQSILVALLAAFGLMTVGRWLKTDEYKLWTWGWLVFAGGIAVLCLAPVFPEIDEHIILLLQTLSVVVFSILLARGTLLAIKAEDVRLYRIRRAIYSLIFLLSILTLLMAIWRWPVSVRHTLWDEHYLWNSHWIISFSVLCSWMVLRNQPRWYLRKSNLLFVSALGLLAVLEVFIVGLILAYDIAMPAAILELLRILTLAEPIVLLLVALAMHTMILDGLIHQLERTLVHVSKNSARLKQMAERDPLTAVLNRHAFYSMVGSKRDDDSRPLGGSVAVIDIDNLKPLNDKYGHQAGDAAIRSVAKAIRSVVRAEDLLFRWGGDEFMVILPHVTIEESRWRFDKLNMLLAKTTLPGLDHPMDITLSVGISPFSSTNSLEKAIEEADERMYARKSEKKRERAKTAAS